VLQNLVREARHRTPLSPSVVPMMDAQPTPSHMAMSTLIRKGIAHFVITTNLDGIHRKSGLLHHKHVCNLHG
jgi:NAD-dependent SIR2 family protein deacetylase